MPERLTWEQIQEKYPDQWVGLVDINWRNDANIESAVVKYVDRSKEKLIMMQKNNENLSCHTTPNNVF